MPGFLNYESDDPILQRLIRQYGGLLAGTGQSPSLPVPGAGGPNMGMLSGMMPQQPPVQPPPTAPPSQMSAPPAMTTSAAPTAPVQPEQPKTEQQQFMDLLSESEADKKKKWMLPVGMGLLNMGPI
jgi:hypothetical protein